MRRNQSDDALSWFALSATRKRSNVTSRSVCITLRPGEPILIYRCRLEHRRGTRAARIVIFLKRTATYGHLNARSDYVRDSETNTNQHLLPRQHLGTRGSLQMHMRSWTTFKYHQQTSMKSSLPPRRFPLSLTIILNIQIIIFLSHPRVDTQHPM